MNVNGLRDKASYSKLKTICRVLKRSKRQVNILIDTRADETTAYKLEKHWGGTVLTTEPRDRANAGVAILSSYPAEAFTNIDRDPEGKYLLANLKVEGESFLIAAIYAPADNAANRKRFFTKINDVITERQESGRVVLLGDFNMI